MFASEMLTGTLQLKDTNVKVSLIVIYTGYIGCKAYGGGTLRVMMLKVSKEGRLLYDTGGDKADDLSIEGRGGMDNDSGNGGRGRRSSREMATEWAALDRLVCCRDDDA